MTYLFVASPVLSREVSGRCHCFSRPLPLLAAAAANIVPVRCQRKRRGLFPTPVWPGPNLSPPFSSHPCCCGKARGLSSCLPFLCAHKQVNCYIITSFFERPLCGKSVKDFGRAQRLCALCVSAREQMRFLLFMRMNRELLNNRTTPDGAALYK